MLKFLMSGVFIYFGIATCFPVNSFGNEKKTLVERYLDSTENCHELELRLYICGEDRHLRRLESWIVTVRGLSIGADTLDHISNSGHKLLIMHSAPSLGAGGKTLAPLSSRLTNGIGADAVIQMNLDMPEQGSHLVSNRHKTLIPFTAIQNFFHELSHARHKMNGQWRIYDSEGQAIDDENLFRQQEGLLNNKAYDERASIYYDFYEQIWFGRKQQI